MSNFMEVGIFWIGLNRADLELLATELKSSEKLPWWGIFLKCY